MPLCITVVSAAVVYTELTRIRGISVAVKDPVRNIYTGEVGDLCILGDVHRCQSSLGDPVFEHALGICLVYLEGNDACRFEHSFAGCFGDGIGSAVRAEAGHCVLVGNELTAACTAHDQFVYHAQIVLA